MTIKDYLSVAPEIQQAIDEGRPVVALESTILSHGMPYPENLEFAHNVEKIVRGEGAVPATTAIIGGKLKVGLNAEELEIMCKANGVGKVSRRDVAVYLATGKTGATTVATTMIIAAMAGMLEHVAPKHEDNKPLVAATMFGVTTPAVQKAQAYLESKGFEVLVFHATGTGGKCMEALVNGGFIKGVLDLTTTEWCDEVVGGVLAAGPDRCSAAALNGVPAVVSVGADDMVNFGPWETVPEQYKSRNLYKHNPTVTLMRTTAEENEQIGHAIAEKVNMSIGPCAVMLPLKGVSMIDAEGQPFYGPEEDAALFKTLKDEIDPAKAEVIEMDAHVNDDEFAIAAAQKLIDLMEK